MSDLAPFWISDMQTRIEADWIKMHEDQHRARMREITATLSPAALHELWGGMKLKESETNDDAALSRKTAEFVRAQAEAARLAAEEARSAVLPPASFTKIGEPKKLYKSITITEWKEVDG